MDTLTQRITESAGQKPKPRVASQSILDLAAGSAMSVDTSQALAATKTVTSTKAATAQTVKRVRERKAARAERMESSGKKVTPLDPGSSKLARIRGASAVPVGPAALTRATLNNVSNAAARASLPLAVAGATSMAFSAWEHTREKGGDRVDAALSAGQAAAPTAAGITAGAALAKIAPAMIKFAGPIGLGVTAIKAGYDAWKGYEKDGVKGAARGAADSLTFGLATKAGNMVADIWSGKSGGKSVPDGTGTTDQPTRMAQAPADARAFEAANQHYSDSHMTGQADAGPGEQTEPGAPFAGKRRGWSNQARVAAAQSRGIALPYGGNPEQGPADWNMPRKDKS